VKEAKAKMLDGMFRKALKCTSWIRQQSIRVPDCQTTDKMDRTTNHG
jgi:hypothetical protein